MGVIQVQNKFPAFRFAGESSKDYNVYITDVNVFDSAARDTKSVEIPGRNGAYILDHGRYKNVAVKYDCAIGAQGSTGAEDFAEAVAAVRSWLGSHVGYYRLENDLNPDEYRMAAFTGEIEVDTVGVQMGRFSVKFDCKPQRFLVDGDTAQTITSGDTIENPTAFNARPLLMVWGDGHIIIGDNTITMEDVPVGGLMLANYSEAWDSVGIQQGQGTGTKTRRVTIDESLMNQGDTITIASFGFTYRQAPTGLSGVTSLDSISVSYNDTFTDKTISRFVTTTAFQLGYSAGPFTFTAGTAGTESVSGSISCRFTQNGTSATESAPFSASVAYDGAGIITITKTFYHPARWETDFGEQMGDVTAYSTKTPQGSAVFIDLDIGEIYFHVDGAPVSANSLATLPAELPELPPGETAITFDNTVTQLQVVPRWWRL